MDILDSDLKLAAQGAKSAARSARGLVSYPDLVSEANLWLVQHMDKVVQWRDEGRHGQNKLRNACRQRCLTIVAAERRLKNRLTRGDDQYYYTPGVLREILPDIFDHEDWIMSVRGEQADVKGPSRPAEGNNRLAMICDVRAAFYGLPQKDQLLLEELHRDGGLSYEVLAFSYECHERTVRRREERVLEKLVERLGGEPPYWS
jgi:DNA-directed RNA polymerase specialized sigma24 family protein